MNKLVALRLRIRDRLLRLYTDDYVKLTRRRTARRAFNALKDHLTPLTPALKQDILSFWGQYRDVKKELHWFEFYNTACENKELLKYYIPDNIYYAEIDTFFTNARRAEAIDDKNLYDLYFHDINRPRAIIRKINGELFDTDYQRINTEQAIERCLQARQVVSKQAIDSCGGHGVKFFDVSSESVDGLKSWLDKNDNIVIQEVVKQHECLNAIHADSINTIRIMSLFLDGEVTILSALLRMGAGGSRVDNGSSGGVFCGINADGTLKEVGHYTDGRTCTQHPQGTVFKGYKIIGYDRCCETVKKLAGRMYTTSQLISWDFAVGADGEPVLIEVNLTDGGLSTHLLSNGPLFGDKTPDILARVYHSKK